MPPDEYRNDSNERYGKKKERDAADRQQGHIGRQRVVEIDERLKKEAQDGADDGRDHRLSDALPPSSVIWLIIAKTCHMRGCLHVIRDTAEPNPKRAPARPGSPTAVFPISGG
ncbi:hypothetical protein ACBI99_32575 [Nonomuraea sp. ATR24]|uniref:hypothetical protein n=1 Tax=Nonomuraea sp. ATR24 TaxID=1676744 RepID=UPI0035C1E91E